MNVEHMIDDPVSRAIEKAFTQGSIAGLHIAIQTLEDIKKRMEAQDERKEKDSGSALL